MSSGQPVGHDAATDWHPVAAATVATLVEPLLTARSQPAVEQFDHLIAAAVASHTLSPALARELRYWQRASVHEVVDHLRTVLPVVLPVAIAAVAASANGAAAAVEAATETWAHRHDAVAPTVEPVTGQAAAQTIDLTAHDTATPEVVVSASDDFDADAQVDVDVDNPQIRRRLFVAGLTSTA